ncbi:6,7-dimethyl-8-ribityllumazine synthase [Levilactobacillus acidifarinae]|uniref:6,7-dimethyl-8-ribityllumazine synthase n=1 Tax=Levilactobacillus acidifarinae DSM 19394 = JCM 15949 TaxID=1423715 RepID=A0A0R1LJD8_9LACO|nr:6,7-dimethyl-8-ribityllumazine synthase [Levilactobacillus acidifarinae]KRK96059.1 6,7-dimethyl-8-ribityllumazine synthase [Levilactobacillus acidifarinae DSM 19394]GEO69667.1 6,7-dimethyl-8-ribityllumazine synthase [Levilactobacillus acidifarinae]
MTILATSRQTAGYRIGIVTAQFNQVITQKLETGAMSTLQGLGVAADNILVAHVPGALELTRASRLMADSGRVDGILALGSVIRGETSHYDYVCAETARSLANLSATGPVPVMFGVLTTDDLAQAFNRAGGKAGNKGSDCAAGVLTMLNLQMQLTPTT